MNKYFVEYSARNYGTLPASNKTIAWDYGAAVAQGTHNPLVVGSNPSGPIKKRLNVCSSLFFLTRMG